MIAKKLSCKRFPAKDFPVFVSQDYCCVRQQASAPAQHIVKYCYSLLNTCEIILWQVCIVKRNICITEVVYG